MPWIPELFTVPALEHIRDQARRDVAAVPYFQGLATGETDALVRSFAGEPELHHPYYGRVKGRRAFERFVAETNAWLVDRNAVFQDAVERIITPQRGVEEAMLGLDTERGRVELPVAIAADRDDRSHILELRVYFSTWPATGRHAGRPRLLQPDPGVRVPDVVGEYQRALADGDAEAAVAAFEPDAYVREPSGGGYVHRGPDELRALYERYFSDGGGIALEHCATTDDGRACALEYNIVGWGRTEMAPAAGLAVHVRGATGKLAAVRIYDDSDPP
jgi:SnoaL-like domain